MTFQGFTDQGALESNSGVARLSLKDKPGYRKVYLRIVSRTRESRHEDPDNPWRHFEVCANGRIELNRHGMVNHKD
jgi:hypothetical protein